MKIEEVSQTPGDLKGLTDENAKCDHFKGTRTLRKERKFVILSIHPIQTEMQIGC